jgi:hypothetical protein
MGTGVIGTVAAWIEHWQLHSLATVYGAGAGVSALLVWIDWLRVKLFPAG